MTSGRPPVALVILDGWGLAPEGPGNAVALASTPVFDRLSVSNPSTRIAASGLDVGLPDGQIGNSEVGHLNLGAGRVVYQDLTRIDRAIDRGELARNETLAATCASAARGRGVVHLIGLASFGGVHSHLRHIVELVDIIAAEGVREVRVHAITDGRDVLPDSSLDDMEWLERELGRVEAVHDGSRAFVASVVGRYWAMDRDQRWDRTRRAFDLLVHGEGRRAASARDAVRISHEEGTTDEFVEPFVIGATDTGAGIDPADVVVVANFRPDRMRQLVPALTAPEFDAFPRGDRWRPVRHAATMCEYDPAFDLPVLFPRHELDDVLADVLAEHGIGQLHVAETEKYAHVTYFFNGGIETEHCGEVRHLAPSPRDVATYDLRPEMSARDVADLFVDGIADPAIGFAVVNFANPDMVGHTGVLAAAIAACETVDTCLGRVVDAVLARGGTCIVTADHGNAEQMLTPDGTPHTAHTTNEVPVIVVRAPHGPRSGRDELRAGGRLADIAPTILDLVDLPVPAAMTGRSLLEPAHVTN